MDVLQGVAQYKSSKEIARDLKISPHTVDQRMKRIQAILGVTTRFEAARLYMTSLGNLPDEEFLCGDLVYQSSALPINDLPSHSQLPPGEWNPVGGGEQPSLREAQAHYFAGDHNEHWRRSWFSVPFQANRSNELSPTARTMTIVTIMLLSLLVMGALVSLAEGLSRIF